MIKVRPIVGYFMASGLIISVFAISTFLYLEKEELNQHIDQQSLGSLNYEFLGKVQGIHQVQSKNPHHTVPQIELMNLNSGAGLAIEKMQICDLTDSPSSILHAEQILKILWEAKSSGKLVRIGYSSMWEKCIKSVKMSLPPTEDFATE